MNALKKKTKNLLRKVGKKQGFKARWSKADKFSMKREM